MDPLTIVRDSCEHDGYLALGQQQLADDRAEEAVDAFRHAVFLNPDDLLTRFWYAVSLQRCGVHKRSLMQIQKLFSTLNEMSKDEVLSDGQTTVGDLLGATQQLKEKLI
jgi:cytochrome c-type biogenesis protein CcmH/NrfG